MGPSAGASPLMHSTSRHICLNLLQHFNFQALSLKFAALSRHISCTAEGFAEP